MGVTQSCASSSLYRDSVRASFHESSNNAFSVITNYESPVNALKPIQSSSTDVSFNISSGDKQVYYWKLPLEFTGNKLTSYGGNLYYTIRIVRGSDFIPAITDPDVVIENQNDVTILHYRSIFPNITQSYRIPFTEEHWKRSDGKQINRQYFMMVLADIKSIFIRTIHGTTAVAVLSNISLDTASEHGSNERALEVEQCACPQGHIGLSCEGCAPGYTKNQNVLGLCERCNCNGHSDECDPQAGVCLVSVCSFLLNCILVYFFNL